jgi:class 3 adenylate cyclase
MSAKMGARRLTAILAADIAGYSALMGENEIDTVAALKGHQSIILPMIAGFEGRIIDTAGDGVLAEFSSVLNAVKCAVAIQETLLERNASVAPDRRMLFRIGINQGDVLFDNDRIFGDGINVAARLEGLCEPGGICISGKVYEEIKSRFQIRYEDLGRQTLKNIAEPVQAYRISVSGAPASKTKQSAKSPLRESLNRLIGAGAVVATLCAVWLGWSVYMPSRLTQTGPVVPLEAQATADERAWSDAISIRTTQAFTQYLDHFSNGLHAADARQNLKKADESTWIDAMDIGTIAALNQYLSQFPEGAHVTQAASRIAELQRQAADEKVWSAAVFGGTKEAFNQYVKTLPSGIHVKEAFERLSEIDGKQELSTGAPAVPLTTPDPPTTAVPLSRPTADEAAWLDAVATGTITSFNSYLTAFPAGAHAAQARDRVADLGAPPGLQSSRRLAVGPFDGTWVTQVDCPKAGTAGAFSILVDTDVKDGVFHGEKGNKGKAGWFLLDGRVESDGTVELVARGIVNSSLLAAGNVPVGTEYGYRVAGRLVGSKGTGERVGGRSCKVTFSK